VKAVDDVSFDIYKGKAVGLIGETGSGKTTVAFSILRLIPHLLKTRIGVLDPTKHTIFGRLVKTARRVVSKGEIVDGEILFKGKDLLKLPETEVRKLRGHEISMIFQNPVAAMHPMKIIGYQTGEPKETHERIRWEKLRKVVFDYLGKVELKEPKKRYYHDPHRFSGGEGQRIMIAMALICNPSLLIADEPTSSLDVLVKRQVLELVRKMKKEFDLSMLLITHELGVIAEMSDYVGVMYAGKLMEYGDVFTIFENPAHPYTKGLLASMPRMDKKVELKGIPGSPPDQYNLPKGCRFHPRCKYSKGICSREEPEAIETKPGHLVACSRAYDI
jgi:peptide/nickel transport system ATP-binding protein